jgi:HJR/Mrr/RecB family endonuclease
MSGRSRVPKIAPWQHDFIRRYLADPKRRSILVAEPGTGKSMTAVLLGRQMLDKGLADSVLVVTPFLLLREQWRYAGRAYGLQLADFSADSEFGDGAAITSSSLRGLIQNTQWWSNSVKLRRWLIIVDEPSRDRKQIGAFVDEMLSLNAASKVLFLSRTALEAPAFDAEFRFNTEFIADPATIILPETEIRVAKYSPTFSMLRQLQRDGAGLDALHWREFEKLIAGLLELEGYEVELMRGTKDNGVDIVAVKDLGTAGFFKTLWQAKKNRTGNKVGISVVRELADTREEFGASKALIVTSSYLTRGALQRVERDRFVLGKVDRDDLDGWMKKVLFAQGRKA